MLESRPPAALRWGRLGLLDRGRVDLVDRVQLSLQLEEPSFSASDRRLETGS